MFFDLFSTKVDASPRIYCRKSDSHHAVLATFCAYDQKLSLGLPVAGRLCYFSNRLSPSRSRIMTPR